VSLDGWNRTLGGVFHRQVAHRALWLKGFLAFLGLLVVLNLAGIRPHGEVGVPHADKAGHGEEPRLDAGAAGEGAAPGPDAARPSGDLPQTEEEARAADETRTQELTPSGDSPRADAATRAEDLPRAEASPPPGQAAEGETPPEAETVPEGGVGQPPRDAARSAGEIPGSEATHAPAHGGEAAGDHPSHGLEPMLQRQGVALNYYPSGTHAYHLSQWVSENAAGRAVIQGFHALHAAEAFPGFWALFGLAVAVVLVRLSKGAAHTFLGKREDFYDR